MHHNLGFYATWLPGEAINVGDVGVLKGGRFRCLSSLRELGIRAVTAQTGTLVDVQYTSTRGTSISTSAGVNAVVGSGQITIDFSDAGAFLFHAMQMRPTRLENRAEVSDDILHAYEIRKWEKEWLLIEAVHIAKSTTVVISEDSKARLVLSAEAKGPIASLPLADPNASFSVVSTQGRLFHTIGARELRPLYSCLRLDDPLLGRPTVLAVRGPNQGPGVVLSRPTIDELIDS